MKAKQILLFYLLIFLGTATAQTNGHLHFIPESDCSDGKLIALMQRQLDENVNLESEIEAARKMMEDCAGMGQASEEKAETETEEESESKAEIEVEPKLKFAETEPVKHPSARGYPDEREPAVSFRIKEDFSQDHHSITVFDNKAYFEWWHGIDCTSGECDDWQKTKIEILKDELEKPSLRPPYKTIVLDEEDSTISIFDLSLQSNKYRYERGFVQTKDAKINSIAIVVTVKKGIKVLTASGESRLFSEIDSGFLKENRYDDFAQNLSALLAHVVRRGLECEVKYFDAKNRKAILWIKDGGKSMPVLLIKQAIRKGFNFSPGSYGRYKSKKKYDDDNFDALLNISTN